jgi:hypothetical protein
MDTCNQFENRQDDSNLNGNLEPYIYSIDTFLKYRDLNKKSHPNFNKYYIETLNNFKYKKQDIFDRQDLRIKLNYILTKKNISNEDETLYKLLLKTLNKVNNNMLLPNDSKNIGRARENTLEQTINILTTIKYSKVEHFQKLAELIVDKALNEQNFSSIYAILCCELSKYYIEIGNSKKVHFRHILLNICQTNFETFLNNCENMDKIKLIGIAKFLGELYVKGLLPAVIIKGCFDRMGQIIDKVNNISECISELIMTTYKTLYNESKDNNSTISSHIKTKIHIYIDYPNLPLKSKFHLQNVLEKIEEIEK